MSGAALRAAVADHERVLDLHADAVGRLARLRWQRDAAAGRLDLAETAAAAAGDALADGDGEGALDALKAATRALNEARSELQIIEDEALPSAIQKVEILAGSVAEAARRVSHKHAQGRSEGREGAYERAYAEMLAAFERAKAIAAEDAAEISAVNADLPKGTPPLPTLEARLRDAPKLPREVLSAEPIKCWCFKRSGERLNEAMAAQVRDNGDGTGRTTSAGAASALAGGADVERREFSRQVVRRGRPAFEGDRISTLEIPPLRRGRPTAEPVIEIVPVDE